MSSVQERQAWFTLGVFGFTLAVYTTLVAVLGFHWGATGAFGFLALAGLTPFVGMKERKQHKVVVDERDMAFQRAASLIAYAVFWVAFVVVCMLPIALKGPRETINISTVLPAMLVITGVCVVAIVRSLVLVVLYRRGRDGQPQTE